MAVISSQKIISPEVKFRYLIGQNLVMVVINTRFFISNHYFWISTELLRFFKKNQYSSCLSGYLGVKQLKIDLSTELAYLILIFL